MRTRVGVIVLLLIVFGAGFQGCRTTLAMLTKNAKRTIINTHNERYDLVVKLNLSTGCPQSSFGLGSDSVLIENGNLTEVINTLSEKTNARMAYLNERSQKRLKLDIRYRYKTPVSRRALNDTLLTILSKRLHVDLGKDTVLKSVQVVQVVDASKLSQHAGKGEKARMLTPNDPKKPVEFINCTLDYVFQQLENKTPFLFQWRESATGTYNLTIPRHSISQLRSYLKNECGLELVEKTLPVEFTTVMFRKL